MKIRSAYYFLFFLLILQAYTNAQDSAYYNNNYIRYENFTYKRNIKTVQLFEESWELAPPCIKFNSDQKLRLRFDDLDAINKRYSYTVIHCAASWEPSELLSNEYIDGFADLNINEYQYSFNTTQKFIHYAATFPNDNMKFLKSGNYLLKVYEDSDPANLVLTRRFMVADSKVDISTQINAATIVADRNYKQEIDFSIFYPNLNIRNPYDDIKVVLTQNDRWDNAIIGLKPLYVKDKELVYDLGNGDNCFSGGNEFRYFDTRGLRYQEMRTKTIIRDSLGTHFYLLDDEKRSFKRYMTAQDIDGKYLIKTQDQSDSELRADYVYVHFFLPYDLQLTDGNMYILGSLTDWRFERQNKLIESKRKGYECTLYLKQGYYNYEYVFLKDGENKGDETVVEGAHYETENDYAVYVYYRALGTSYDQLVAMKRFNTMTR